MTIKKQAQAALKALKDKIIQNGWTLTDLKNIEIINSGEIIVDTE